MKKKRLILITTIMLGVIFLLFFSSTFFQLKEVELIFYDLKDKVINLEDNLIYNTSEYKNKILNSANFEFGKILFLHNKNEYIKNIEESNDLIEVIDIEAVFPNKFKVNARERIGMFYFQSAGEYYILDKDFKILKITNEKPEDNLCEISFFDSINKSLTFFEYFEITKIALDKGQFLDENNLIFMSIKNIFSIFKKIDLEFFKNSKILIKDKSSNSQNLIIYKNDFVFEIEEVLINFDKKAKKLCSGYLTVLKNSLRTSGKILVDKNINCFWYNL